MRTPQPWLRTSTGTWHVVIDGKQKYLGKAEAEARENFDRLLDHGVLANATVREIIQAYWAWAKKNLAEATCERRRSTLESFRLAVPATLKGSKLRAFHVQRWLDDNDKKRIPVKGKGNIGRRMASDEPLSPTTINNYITLIKGMMSWAKAMGYVERNPIEDMRKPAARVRQEFLPVDVWPKLLEVVSSSACKPVAVDHTVWAALALTQTPSDAGRSHLRRLRQRGLPEVDATEAA